MMPDNINQKPKQPKQVCTCWGGGLLVQQKITSTITKFQKEQFGRYYDASLYIHTRMSPLMNARC